MFVYQGSELVAHAGIYFEKVLKHSKTCIWTRNVQMGSVGGESIFLLLTTTSFVINLVWLL